MRYLNLFVFILLIIFGFGCAVPGEISGGPKDIEAPKIISYFPDSHLINFKGKLITFTCNEKIQLKSLSTQLLITPNMEEPPQIEVEGNKLNIAFKKALQENTTYIFNLGNAISDLNEDNRITDFKYIFSTGSFIDSIKINGVVKDAFTNSVAKDIKIMLFIDTGTTDLIRRKPNYFTKSNPSGQYQFTNIRTDNYKVLAIEDKNNNNVYDNKDEKIGFIEKTVVLTQDTTLTDISIFKEEEDLRLSKKTINQVGKIELLYTQRIDEVKLKGLDNKSNIKLLGPYYNKLSDSVVYFYSHKIEDTLTFSVISKRQNESTLTDTLFIPPVLKSAKRNEATGKGDSRSDLGTLLKPNLRLYNVPHYKDTLKLFSSVPIGEINTPPICKTGKYLIKGNWKIDATDPRLLISDIIIAADKEYQVIVPLKTITSIYEKTNDSAAFTFKTQPVTYYGTIKLNIKANTLLSNGPYIVKLIDEKGNIADIKEKNGAHYYEFPFLNPLDYNLKIEVGDKKWQTGHYKKKLQAANVFMYKEIIKLRSDWISEVEWLVD